MIDLICGRGFIELVQVVIKGPCGNWTDLLVEVVKGPCGNYTEIVNTMLSYVTSSAL